MCISHYFFSICMSHITVAYSDKIYCEVMSKMCFIIRISVELCVESLNNHVLKSYSKNGILCSSFVNSEEQCMNCDEIKCLQFKWSHEERLFVREEVYSQKVK
jgi:hypothetical protein